jgi:hypothetical protein
MSRLAARGAAADCEETQEDDTFFIPDARILLNMMFLAVDALDGQPAFQDITGGPLDPKKVR